MPYAEPQTVQQCVILVGVGGVCVCVFFFFWVASATTGFLEIWIVSVFASSSDLLLPALGLGG